MERGRLVEVLLHAPEDEVAQPGRDPAVDEAAYPGLPRGPVEPERILGEKRDVDHRLSFLKHALHGPISHESRHRADHEVGVGDRLGHVAELGEIRDHALRTELGHPLDPHGIEVDPKHGKTVVVGEVTHDRAADAATAQYHDSQDFPSPLMSLERLQIRPYRSTYARGLLKKWGEPR